MTRNVKALGLALVAVFAFSAMAASSASAVDTFTVTPSPLTVAGVSQDHAFKITNASGGSIAQVECTTANFESTVSIGSTATVKVRYEGQHNTTPHGENCTASGGTAAVAMNDCDYVVTGSTTGVDGGTDATFSIICPSTNEIIIVANMLLCTLKIPAQTPTSGGLTYINEAGGKLKVKTTSTGITFTSEGFGCAIAGIPSEGNNSDYTGNLVVSSASGAISVSTS